MNARRLAFILINLAIIGKASGNGKKKHESNQLKLPNFINVCEVKSSVAGRIRLKFPLLVNNEILCRELMNRLEQIDVIKSIKINSVTGSVTIEYDPNSCDAYTLQGAVIKLLNLDDAVLGKQTSKVQSYVKDMSSALNGYVYGATKGYFDLKTVIASVMLIVGLYGLPKANRSLTTAAGGLNPGVATLFWWGSTMLLTL